jgi:hypothetical protein
MYYLGCNSSNVTKEYGRRIVRFATVLLFIPINMSDFAISLIIQIIRCTRIVILIFIEIISLYCLNYHSLSE